MKSAVAEITPKSELPISGEAISLRQPWAWLVVMGFKPIENRKWKTSYRGPIWIHAAQGMTFGEWAACWKFVNLLGLSGNMIPNPHDLVRGAVIGGVTLVDCVTESDNSWFTGPYGFVLENAFALRREVPCRGALGIFDIETRRRVG